LSVHPFEKTSMHELLTETDPKTFTSSDSNQLMMFDL